MVKFGKEFRLCQKAEWKGKYLNYKKLKQYINGYISQEYLQKKTLLLSEFDFPQKHSKSEIVKHFISLLDHEIKMFYLFYNKEEKQLHKDINTRLYSNDDYPTLDKDEYITEYNDLHKVSLKALDLAKFVYYNCKALIKIIKKFDKKYLKDRVNDHIKYKYIQYKLEEQNSDILDMYKFKIIDEVCALVENLVKDLHENYKRNKHLFKDNDEVNGGEGDERMVGNDKHFSSTNSVKDIINNIQLVDQYSLQIKTLFKPWDSFLKISNTINNQLYAITKEINVNTGINNNNNNDHGNTTNNNQIELDGSNLNVEGFNQLESSHLSKTIPFLFKRKQSIMTNMLISRENKANANIIFIHTFLYFFSYSIQIPCNLTYLSIFKKDDYYTGLFNAMTPIGAFISFVYSIIWSFYSTKKPAIIALLFLLIGNVCCTLSQHYNTFYLLLAGRFVIGLGCNRIGNKMYLYNYIPKQDLNKYISYFHVVTLLGLSCGFLVNIPLIIYKERNNNNTNYYWNDNLGTLICSVVSVFVFFYALLTLTEAFNPEFFPTMFSIDGKETTINRKTAVVANDNNDEHKQTEATISMTLNESMRKDTNMIYDINEKLDQFNEQNEYVDNNLVAKTVRQLTKNEKKQLRFLKGSFYVFVIIVFVSKVINEFILINSPLYLKTFKTFDNKILSLLLGVSFVIVLIIEYIIFITKKCLKDRTSMLILLVMITVLSLLCILQFWHKANDWEYYVGMVGLIILSNFLEKTASSFFAKIISNDYKMCCMQGNSVINVATNFGRIIGAAIPLVLIKVGFENMNKGTFFVFMMLSVVAFVIALCFYEDLRVKPISRILEKEKNQNLQIPNDI